VDDHTAAVTSLGVGLLEDDFRIVSEIVSRLENLIWANSTNLKAAVQPITIGLLSDEMSDIPIPQRSVRRFAIAERVPLNPRSSSIVGFCP
jgi:hypothetical protein